MIQKFPLHYLKIDSIIDKPVFLSSGKEVIKANQVITEEILNKLIRLGIQSVYISDEATASLKKDTATFSLASIPDPEERIAIKYTMQSLVKIYSLRDEFKNKLSSYAIIIEEVYNHIIQNIPQIDLNKIRNIADDIVLEVYEHPSLFIFTYPNPKKETSIYQHVLLTAIFASTLCYELAISKLKANDLIFGILLMDVGMLKMPKEILYKPGALTPQERKIIQTHPIYSYKLLIENAKLKTNLARIALEHQEDLNGEGYPRKLKGNQISPFTKINRIADSFVSMLELKAYRKLKTPYEAMKELVSLGVSRYDPNFLKVFVERISIYPVLSLVELNDHSLGIVIGVQKSKPLRPIILKIRDSKNNIILQPEFIHLVYKRDYFIVKTVNTVELAIDTETEILKFVPLFKNLVKN